MPITPFHFGPGLLIKAATPRHFSLSAFVAANVIIDLESLFHLLQDAWPVHRMLHTFALGSIAGLAAGWLVHRAARAATASRYDFAPFDSLRADDLKAALVGGLLGGASHSVLDGIMHSDIRPFHPFSGANPLLGLVDLGTLHLTCVVTGVAGLAWLGWRQGQRPLTDLG